MYPDAWKCILVHLPLKDMFKMSAVSKQLNAVLIMPQWSHQYQLITGRKFNWLMFMLMKYPAEDWSPRKLSMNKSADIRYLCETGIIDWEALYDNEQLLDPEVLQYVNSLLPDDYAESFKSRTASWGEIVKGSQCDWDWYEVSSNRDINIQLVNGFRDADWNFDALSSNNAITWDDVVNNPDLPWYCANLSFKPNPNWDYIIENHDDTWEWYKLSQVVPFEVVLLNPNLNWDWDSLSKNPSVSFETILANPQVNYGSDDGSNDGSDDGSSSDNNHHPLIYRWKLDRVSSNPSVNIDIVKNNPDFPWDWDLLSSNPSMTPKIVDANPSLPWNWYNMSCNKSLTWEYVYRNFDRDWDWEGLSDMW